MPGSGSELGCDGPAVVGIDGTDTSWRAAEAL
jgi:hypothetical protein